jgi:hypothetical protein
MGENPNHLLPLLRHGNGMMTGWRRNTEEWGEGYKDLEELKNRG